jgi:hypothetical protein
MPASRGEAQQPWPATSCTAWHCSSASALSRLMTHHSVGSVLPNSAALTGSLSHPCPTASRNDRTLPPCTQTIPPNHGPAAAAAGVRHPNHVVPLGARHDVLARKSWVGHLHAQWDIALMQSQHRRAERLPRGPLQGVAVRPHAYPPALPVDWQRALIRNVRYSSRAAQLIAAKWWSAAVVLQTRRASSRGWPATTSTTSCAPPSRPTPTRRCVPSTRSIWPPPAPSSGPTQRLRHLQPAAMPGRRRPRLPHRGPWNADLASSRPAGHPDLLEP